jgi:PAS domain S-box-containing protein
MGLALAGMPLVGNYDHPLVVLSIFIAISASYAAIDLGARVTAARGWIRPVWLAGGATVMGLGIWSMHFTGMLAFRLPIPVAYHWPTVFLSLLAAIFGSGMAFYLVSREKLGVAQTLTGGAVMGLALAGMHYTGMAAMRFSAVCGYSPLLVCVSILIAVVASFAAISFTFNYRQDFRGTIFAKLLSAGVMGGGISLVHYTGMMAANFFLSNAPPNLSRAIDIPSLGLAGIVIGTLVVQGVTILTSTLDRQAAARAQERQASECFRQVGDNLRDVLMLSKPDFSEVLFANRAYERIWGRTLGSLYANPSSWLEGVHPEDRGQVQEQLQLLIGGQPIESLEFRVTRPDASISWVRLQSNLIFDDQGHVSRMVSIVHEFTFRKQAEDARRQIEEQYRIVVETATDAIVSIGENSQILFANPAAFKLFGYDSAELMGQPLTILMPVLFRDLYKASLQGYLVAGRRHTSWQRVEWIGLRKDGGEFPVEVCFDEVTRQGQRVFTGFIRDISERKGTEDQLRLVINTIPAIVWSKLPDGSADFLNQQFREYTGFTFEEGLRWGWINAFHPDDRLVEEWRARLAVGKPFEKEVRLRRADGEYRWFSIRAVPLRDEHGEVVKWYETSSDIDDRKRAEDRARLIVETIPTMVWTLAPEGKLDFVNQRWVDYTGISLEEAIADPTRPVHPDDLPGVLDMWRSSIANGEPFQHELRVRRADGEFRWMLAREVPLHDERGNIVKWFGSIVDIEDSKQAERRSREMIDAIPQQIWSGPADGTLDYCNKRWRDDTGLGLEEIRGDGWQKMLHPEDRDRVLIAWSESVTNGTPYEQEERHRDVDGTYRWYLSRGVPLRDAEGRIVRWYGTNTDIEDRKRAEEALKSSEREQRLIAAQLERERARLVEAQKVAKIGSWETDLQSLNVIWSEQTHRIFETNPSLFHPTRARFLEFVRPEDRAKVDAAFAESLDKRTPSSVEYRIVMPDGRVKILEERWRVFHDEEGKPVRLAGTCRDITERVQADEELQRLSGKVLHLQDEERRRISRELHDSTGQTLAGLATDLSQLRASLPPSSRKLRELASRCQELANQCIREVRTLSYLMYPPLLDESGLADAISHFVNGFTKRSGIKVELEVDPSFGRLKEHVELALFRVVQESLTNIHRHSGSPSAKVVLDRQSDRVTVEVSDTGHGISGKKPVRNRRIPFPIGIGISSMIERIKLVDGVFEIVSGAGGTTVRAIVPEAGRIDDRASRGSV